MDTMRRRREEDLLAHIILVAGLHYVELATRVERVHMEKVETGLISLVEETLGHVDRRTGHPHLVAFLSTDQKHICEYVAVDIRLN